MDDHHGADLVRRRALLRFAVIGDLLVAPPPKGQLAAALERLATKTWTGVDGAPIRFARSTIEHWYYTARNATDPVRALTAAARSDRGTFKVMDNALLDALEEQYTRYPEWTAKLHADNLAASVRRHHPERVPPSYTTVRRTLRRKGWARQRKVRTEGQRQALIRKGSREVRGFEMDHAHALWHLPPRMEGATTARGGSSMWMVDGIRHCCWPLSTTAPAWSAISNGICPRTPSASYMA